MFISLLVMPAVELGKLLIDWKGHEFDFQLIGLFDLNPKSD